MPSKPPQQPPGRPPQPQTRAERVAAALRENLRKRKEQARARDTQPEKLRQP